MDETISDGQRKRLRRRLIEMRGELLTSIEQSEAAAAPVELDQSVQGRLSRMDAMQGQAMASAALNRSRRQLQTIGNALGRIDDDEYGYCTECGELIAAERLMLNPSHVHCVGCAQ